MMTTIPLWYLLEITIDGGGEVAGPAFNFTYYKDPKHYGVYPDSGPVKGGTKVKLLGSGFNHECGCNKTVRFSVFEMRPLNNSNDSVTNDT
jgi:hypothetical protein